MAGPTYAAINGPGTGSIIPQGGSVGTPLPGAPTTVTAPAASPIPAAPSSTTSTPSAVVSSGQASEYIANTIKPTLDQAKAAQSTAQSAALAAAMANPFALQPNESIPAYNARVAAMRAANAPAPVEKTPEQQIADTPDAGSQWAYDTQGNRVQAPIGATLPIGYSKTNPHTGPTTPVADQSTDPVGNLYKQFSDGTYGKYNAVGVYIGPATPTDFQNSKNGESALNSLNQIAQGTFPLSPREQAQVDSLKASFAALIKQQETANANFTGGTTVAMNLYGMGTSLAGLGEIKGTIDAGLGKIADFNSKMSEAVSKLENAFRVDDAALIKSAYDVYSSTVKGRQDELNHIQDAIDAKQKAFQEEIDMQRKEAQKKIEDDRQYAAMVARDGVDASYKQAQLEISKENLKIDKAKLKIEQAKGAAYVANLQAKTAATQIVGGALEKTGGLSGVNPDGTMNQANLAKLKAAMPPGVFDSALAVVQFRAPLSDIKDAKTREVVRQAALAINPQYDEKQYKPAQDYLTQYTKTTPNTTGGTITALNSMAGHMTELDNYLKVVDSSSWGAKNSITNFIATHGGGLVGMGADRRKAIGGLEAMRQVFSEENLKYLKGATGGEEAAKRMEDLFKGGLSYEEAQGAVKAFTDAVADKARTMQDAQVAALKVADPTRPIMYPKQAIQIAELSDSVGGVKGQFDSILGQTPEGQVYMAGRDDPAYADNYRSAVASLKSVIGREPTPSQIFSVYPELDPSGGQTAQQAGFDTSETLMPE